MKIHAHSSPHTLRFILPQGNKISSFPSSMSFKISNYSNRILRWFSRRSLWFDVHRFTLFFGKIKTFERIEGKWWSCSSAALNIHYLRPMMEFASLAWRKCLMLRKNSNAFYSIKLFSLHIAPKFRSELLMRWKVPNLTSCGY